MSRMDTKRAALLGVTAIVTAGSACVQSRGPAYNRQAADLPPYAIHAVQSRTLRDIMHRMGVRFPEFWPQEIQEDRQADARRARQRRFAEIGRVANELVESSRQISNVLGPKDLTESETGAFVELAQQLTEHAKELRTAALSGDLAAVRSAASRIASTCTECHTRFRRQAGPLPE